VSPERSLAGQGEKGRETFWCCESTPFNLTSSSSEKKNSQKRKRVCGGKKDGPGVEACIVEKAGEGCFKAGTEGEERAIESRVRRFISLKKKKDTRRTRKEAFLLLGKGEGEGREQPSELQLSKQRSKKIPSMPSKESATLTPNAGEEKRVRDEEGLNRLTQA